MKSAWFHGWNLPDFIMKSTRFHEICWILPWNLPDFMNSGFFFRTNTDIHYYMLNRQRFHGLPLNAVFFIRTNTDIHFIHCISPWHEICWISPWNPPDFMNSGFFFRTNTDIHYYMLNRQRFHGLPLNAVFFIRTNTDIHFIHCISPWHEICQISWNSPDFIMKSARFHEIRWISWSTTECCIFFIHEIQYRYKCNV